MMRDDVHTWALPPLTKPGPVSCRPMMLEAAASSSVPVAEGNSVQEPTRFKFPPNEVPRRFGALSWNTLLKVPTLLSAKRNHGWKFDAL